LDSDHGRAFTGSVNIDGLRQARGGRLRLSEKQEIVALLTEIRDNQQLSLQRQEEHLAVAKQQIERSRAQVEQSIELQKAAIDRIKKISRIAFPAILFCVALVVYLLVRYF
jgi:hypothetical protein